MSNNITDLINIRPIEAGDVHFILDSSIQCLSKYTESMFKGWQREDIFAHLETIMLYALTRHDTYSVFVAVDKDDSQLVLAYIIADVTSNHIFFQYTKYTYRKLGIQKHLLMPLVLDPSKPVTVNFSTKEMLKLAKDQRVRIVNKFLERFINE